MSNEDIKLIIKTEYENGTSMSVLSKKYNIKLNTIKGWSYKEKWIKKKRTPQPKEEQPAKRKNNQKKRLCSIKILKLKKIL